MPTERAYGGPSGAQVESCVVHRSAGVAAAVGPRGRALLLDCFVQVRHREHGDARCEMDTAIKTA